jgi:hypothetical protein
LPRPDDLHSVLSYKRLELGRFHRPVPADDAPALDSIEAADLALILEGNDLRGARRRPRWEPVPPSP